MACTETISYGLDTITVGPTIEEVAALREVADGRAMCYIYGDARREQYDAVAVVVSGNYRGDKAQNLPTPNKRTQIFYHTQIGGTCLSRLSVLSAQEAAVKADQFTEQLGQAVTA